MIELVRGNLLEADAEAIVNTVNCIGYMGKGIALQFKKAFPDNFKAYQKACRIKEVRPGRMFIFKTDSLVNPKYIINFPTKRHWRGKSKIEDIKDGLNSLSKQVIDLKIKTIAIPPLGCGLGGLDWQEVRLMIENDFSIIMDVRVFLYEPLGTPDARSMPVRTKRPEMTMARAFFIKLMQRYTRFSYRLTLLEIQKLAYFLQETGEPLRLKYETGLYGPYAHNLNKVLEILEGHYIRGYGDTQKPDVEIELVPGAVKEADKFLSVQPAMRHSLFRVEELIEGFETPYGMELLSSIHWIAEKKDPLSKEDPEKAVAQVLNWNSRKKRIIKPPHIRIAWKRLKELGWI
ncbi:macro domain-containing protein [Desulfobacterales bacterium HSG17]|nr:macro domain-containing protein [Desulfobacterales bacterium HSG17]